MMKLLQPSAEAGFDLYTLDRLHRLIVQYAVSDNFASESELKKRYSLEDRLNETLGWTGLGHCDGGSSGSGTMEICCYVVDPTIAEHVILADLADTEYADVKRIYVEG